MKKNIVSLIFIFAIIFIISMNGRLNAVSTSNINESINTEKLCSLELKYKIKDIPCEGLEIKIYRVLNVSDNFQYNLTEEFSKYPINVNGIKSQNEWNELSNTVNSYIVEDKISPTQVDTTNKDGSVNFINIPVGIYFIKEVVKEEKQEVYRFASFMVAVPQANNEGSLQYDIEVFPKSELITKKLEEEFIVTVIWKDEEFKSKRPNKVSLDFYIDEEFFKTIELKEEDNWTYSWKTEEDHKWNVIEKSLPEEYKVTYDNEKNVFIITNTINQEEIQEENIKKENKNNPNTGDNIYTYIAFTGIAVLGIIITAFAIKIGRNNKNE